jgi:hypothetical protein
VVYARDDDPQLVAEALPFLLKSVEGLLDQSPRNETLLLAACQGYASYAQAFVAVPADYREEVDLAGARRERHRAGRLFLRAREYGLRGLEISHEGITAALHQDPEKALTVTKKEDVPILFWTGAAWAGAINVNKDDMDLVADFNIANALLQRANASTRSGIGEPPARYSSRWSGPLRRVWGSIESAWNTSGSRWTFPGRKAGPYEPGRIGEQEENRTTPSSRRPEKASRWT